MKRTLRISAVPVILFAAAAMTASSQTSDGHVMQTLPEATWGPAPPMLPPGAEIAVLSGNPMGNSLYAVRLRFPAGYVIPAHSHPTDEHVAVTSGALYLGMGDKVNKAAGHALGVGGFGKLPANANHFAFTRVATTIVLFGQGPVEFKYVNPADDPRNAASTK